MDKYGITPENITVDTLDTQADNTYKRFDNFNDKYNPFGIGELRKIFLKSSNHIKGRYYAELTQQIFDRIEAQEYTASELRISIYGRTPDDWDNLAKYILRYKLYSPKQRWLIQVPRIFFVYKKLNIIDNMKQMIDSIDT